MSLSLVTTDTDLLYLPVSPPQAETHAEVYIYIYIYIYMVTHPPHDPHEPAFQLLLRSLTSQDA